MMSQKPYSLSEMETMSGQLSSKAILRKFLQPGIAFEDPPDIPRQMDSNSTIGKHWTRQQILMKANIHNLFVDYQPIYGIPVRVMSDLWASPEQGSWLPVIVRDAAIDYFYTEKGIEGPVVERSPQNQTRTPFQIVPLLGATSIEDREMDYFRISLPEMEEIGIDVENISKTIGDVLAMFIFKCGFWYCGSFFFCTIGKDMDESTGSATIGLCVKDSHRYVERRNPHRAYTREDARKIALMARQQLPSPQTSLYLWDVFKSAFIARGTKYRSGVPDITPEEVMLCFEKCLVDDDASHVGV
ncbi:hypothetical protein FLAG1_06369 [Fusarium langsethiae]|uniref:Uncharacterized protein n=1 Tax=Fusarium langsethiae TaxID=179993 RepID=A0A0N0V6R3_FUSLA|nr:hypothetical protein FLAG1_06369 [Fusarium langsethiae]GKU02943.1 unnamed protein product [Fusarium langsethiae]GKU19938.1 unnamed protein product [Fusarium langsethiae]